MDVVDKLWRNGIGFLFSLLPKNRRKVFCQSLYGKGYGDSPRAVAEELRKRGWKVVWAVRGPEDAASLPPGVQPVVIGSAKEIFHRCTAGVWVDNCRKWGRLFKRKGQYYVQTWHGFPLKRIEGDAEDALSADYIQAAKQDSRMADLFLSDSAFLTEIYRRAFWYDGPVLECGFPRNDILFSPPAGLRERVYGALGVPTEKKLVLYAPTFRADGSLGPYRLDAEKVINACQDRFGGEFALLLRLHPNIADQAKNLSLGGQNVYPATDYPDIQELLALADAVITDYSSLMFDFALTGRPVFQFALDIEDYKKDRDFYFPLEELPFPLAQSNGELEQAILFFDEADYQSRLAVFMERMGIREDGHAAMRCADWIVSALER